MKIVDEICGVIGMDQGLSVNMSINAKLEYISKAVKDNLQKY